MTLYPEQLMPETVENLHLPSGLDVQIPKAAPSSGYGAASSLETHMGTNLC
jgi:hypothetical protein